MLMAIEEAKKGIREGNRGYGAVIVRGSEVIAKTHATTTTEHDITAHAELKAIRSASMELKSSRLTDCTLVATNEPCPMCAATTRWAGIRRIVYGASRQETMAQVAGTRLLSGALEDATASTPEIIAGVLKEDCLALHRRDDPD